MDLDVFDKIITFLSNAFQQQIVSFTFAFTLAALVHSRGVKKEIKTQFQALLDSLDRLGEKLETRIEQVEDAVNKINTRVSTLEKPKE